MRRQKRCEADDFPNMRANAAKKSKKKKECSLEYVCNLDPGEMETLEQKNNNAVLFSLKCAMTGKHQSKLQQEQTKMTAKSLL